MASSRRAASGAPACRLVSAAARARRARRAGSGVSSAARSPNAAAAARPPRANASPAARIQLGRGGLVQVRCGVSPMPSLLIRADLGIGGLGQGAVNALPLPRRSGPVDRRPGLRVTEPHLPAELGQPGHDRRLRCLSLDAEVPGGPPHQHRVPGRFGRGDQQQQLRRGREQGELLPVILFDPAG